MGNSLPVGVWSGEGAVPPPQKMFEIFAWKWHILVAFLPYARFPSVLFIFAAQEFFSENKWLKFHDFSMTLSIFHDFPWLAKIPWLSMTVGTMVYIQGGTTHWVYIEGGTKHWVYIQGGTTQVYIQGGTTQCFRLCSSFKVHVSALYNTMAWTWYGTTSLWFLWWYPGPSIFYPDSSRCRLQGQFFVECRCHMTDLLKQNLPSIQSSLPALIPRLLA